jgi:carbamate kinase
MEPKLRAAIVFLEEVNSVHREREVVITLLETALAALQGNTSTRITS